SVTIPLLQAPYQLVTFSLNAIEVVVSEIAPPLLDLPTHLLPLPFHHIGIHLLFLLFYKQRMRCRGLLRSEGRDLMAPETLCRALHRTKGKIRAKPSGCASLPSYCGDTAQ